MLTRCPHCRTAFRVTREQLLARDGKVRCGVCRRAFNAMGYLDPEERGYRPEAVPTQPAADTDDAPHEDALDAPFLETPMLPEKPGTGKNDDVFADWTAAPSDVSATPEPAAAASGMTPRATSLLHLPDPIDALLAREDADGLPVVPDDEEADAANVSRWSDAPNESAVDAAYPLWPFVLASLLLALLLLFQMAYHYRSELGRQAPITLRIFSAFNIDMPLAKEVEWLSIGAAEFSPRTRPGHFQLVATLKNQSRYPQTWPQLEISLTDSFDNILARRVFAPAEYLSAAAPPAFAPGSVELQLDLDAGDLNPTGYSLYLFYF
ncbi:MAG: DUF3426 domain-containing protein [Zoogloeaceae bacterium]|jgi:predicted Zn finger-like uncharacterized protein|nr:DUF3426 domain-containing protein [Zoogloeaceae bacterium]